MTEQKLHADRLLTSHEVGDLLQVNPSSVKKWVNEGRIAAFRTPGGHRRIRVSDRRDPQLRPSTIYMALLIEGAEEHGLPAQWIAHLRAIPTAADTAAAAAARRMVDDVLARLKR